MRDNEKTIQLLSLYCLNNMQRTLIIAFLAILKIEKLYQILHMTLTG